MAELASIIQAPWDGATF